MIKNLQVLRASAALLVAYYHFGYNDIKVGFFGVDIFFIISGFIMSYVLFKNKRNFFLKRVIKIVPMYYIVTILISILWFLWPHLFHNVFVDGSSLIKSLLFIPYSKFTSGPILSSGWTLNYEMYFYLALSSFLLFTKKTNFILIGTTLLLSATYLLQLSNIINNYYLIFLGNPIVFEFILGVILYWGYKNYKERFNKKLILILLGITSLLCLIGMAYFNLNKVEGNRLLLYGIPSFIITSFFVFSENKWPAETWIYQWFYRLGNASYVIYLIHPFVMNIFLRLLHPLLKFDTNLVAFAELIVSMFFVCITSDFVHRKIEKPLIVKIEQLLLK